jgi:uracil-DNA glycosylase
MLIVLPYPCMKGMLGSMAEKEMVRTLVEYGLNTNTVITYCYPKMSTSVQDKLIKESNTTMDMIISIVSPKMLVLMGSESALPFQKQKPKVDDSHGNIIGNYNGAPMILTYHPEYYTTRSGYEDARYKEHIHDNDWKIIAEYYNRLIGGKDVA